jgi:molybdopterin converting factor small subunit
MVRITVEYNHFLIRKLINRQRETLELDKEINFIKLIDMLHDRYGERVRIKELIYSSRGKKLKLPVLVNGVSVSDADYKLKNGDMVNILSATAGG